MARISWIRDTLSGRLGSIVGSSWKGTSYVKQYTKPKDPKSDKQLVERGIFGCAVRLAHEATAVNGGDQCWQHLRNPEWQERVGLAKRRLDAGKSPGEALPLFPDGYKPDAVLTDVTAQFDKDNSTLVITALLAAQAFSRRIGVEIQYYNSTEGRWEQSCEQTIIEAGGDYRLELVWNADKSYPEGSSIKGASEDDESSLYGSVSFPFTALQEPEVPYVWLQVVMKLLDDAAPEKEIKLYCDEISQAVTATVPLEYTAYSNYTQRLEMKSISCRFVNAKQMEPEYVPWDFFNEYANGAAVQEQSLPLLPGYGLHIKPDPLHQPGPVRNYVGFTEPDYWELDEQLLYMYIAVENMPIKYKVRIRVNTFNMLNGMWFIREIEQVVDAYETGYYTLPYNERNSYPDGAWAEGYGINLDGRPFVPVELERVEFEQEDVP
ncbi:hypothetical protein FACS1894200_00060 [Spirochaetia bacterium]|nr:hypothetical protein FACS1894200_00060 [Spirochaetia bacterium]